jgi:hypothetical protein
METQLSDTVKQDLLTFAANHSMLMKKESSNNCYDLTPIPFSLLPSPFCADSLDKAKRIEPQMNDLIQRLCNN